MASSGLVSSGLGERSISSSSISSVWIPSASTEPPRYARRMSSVGSSSRTAVSTAFLTRARRTSRGDFTSAGSR
ncbi:hypothetical protein FR483_n625R [Paramecium bursaria Chlorella virus FR483]|uniref:Uncharacterized protein n625R n=1 Tax=Paramecium bursaria Chlorella virus FR483 TaxID=399781 RepID=A7J7X9_PBCVF|nr:hypothetical protein FR483_n625R [Paramecium bursaria Chlorella virus FR483]ABT15910.1 hypothetical protein FR483_n625R [Paramecium bursaria Chlorella virus FR483]